MRSALMIASVISLAIASSTFAQNPPPRPTAPPPPPAVTQTNPAQANPASPAIGANAFTETQAKSRIESGGYANISALKKDEKGVWHATAMKDGKSVQVSLDTEGKIVAD